MMIGSILHHLLISEHAYKLWFMSNLCKNSKISWKMAIMCLDMWFKLGIGGTKWHLSIQGATPLIYPLWCQGTTKKEIFQKFSFLANCTPKTEGRGPRSWNWPFSRHFKDIYRLRGILRHLQWLLMVIWWKLMSQCLF